MTKEISRVARYEGRQIDHVNIEKAELDGNGDLYYFRSDSGHVDKANPALLVTRRSNELDQIATELKERDREMWGDVLQPDITLEVIQGSGEKHTRTALLARTALLDLLMPVEILRSPWIRKHGDEVVGLIGGSGDFDLGDMDVNQAKLVIPRTRMGIKALQLVDGIAADAWEVLLKYGDVISRARIVEQRDPSNTPNLQSLHERLDKMSPEQREAYRHLL